ncbi:MAG: hypothetical protein ABW148_06070 [Sedimenticola sp.]
MIKTIKDRQYLYEQTSYRVGGKVKTESRYIGAVNPETGGLNMAQGVQEQEAITTYDMDKIIQETGQPGRDQTTESKPENIPLTLQITADLKRHKISQASALSQYTRFTNFIKERGINPDHIPGLSVVRGSPVSIKKGGIGKAYKVTVPRGQSKGVRADFWRDFRKAQAYTYLDALEQTDPNYFEGLKGNLEQSYKKQNRAIATYIIRTNRKEVFKIGLTLHFLYSKMVSAWSQRHLKAELIGLSDFTDRNTWRDDAAALMGDIQRDGWGACYQKYQVELQQTQAIQFATFQKYRKASLVDTLSGKRRALRREWRKMDARRRAIFQTCDKISVLAPLFDGYPEPLKGSDQPFEHLDKWKSTRGKWREKLIQEKERAHRSNR